MNPLPTLLAIETAGSACSAAVVRDDTLVAAERIAMRHGHGERLLPMVEGVMAAAALRPHELDWIAAAVGPGGFTGIRVGLAAACGIALATGARSIGVSSFAAVAVLVRPRDAGEALLVALDSRRDDLYVQLFAADPLLPLAPPQAVLPDRLAAYVPVVAGARRLLIAGDAADRAAAAMREQRRPVTIVTDSAPDARGVAAVAATTLRRGVNESVPALRPFYLRPPDVSQPRRPIASRPA